MGIARARGLLPRGMRAFCVASKAGASLRRMVPVSRWASRAASPCWSAPSRARSAAHRRWARVGARAAASSDEPWTPPAFEPVTSAYLHLPFCRRRCYYCDFAVSVVGDNVEGDAVRRGMERYVDQLCREIERTPLAPSSRRAAASAGAPPPLRTVFFGGGTPSLVPPDLLARVLAALDHRFGVHPDAEISMEMDPGTFDGDKLDAYVALGVNRVSLGVQSFDADVLASAGRAHTVEESRAAIAAVRACPGVRRWSLDLISGLPGLTPKLWRESLRETVAARPDHVSVYDLQVEEGTPFARWYTPGEGPLPREEDAAEMFRDASSALRAAGYEHYEVSSYAKPGGRCAHNQVYWNGGEKGWYGFGMAATSRVGDGKGRVARPRKMREWEALVDAMPEPVDEREGNADSETGPVDSESADASAFDSDPASASRAELRAEALLDRLMLGLRTRDGVDLEAIAREFGRAVPGEILDVLAEQPAGLAAAYRVGEAGGEETTVALGEGEARVDAGGEGGGWRVRLTDPEGLMVSTEVISNLVARVPSLEAL